MLARADESNQRPALGDITNQAACLQPSKMRRRSCSRPKQFSPEKPRTSELDRALRPRRSVVESHGSVVVMVCPSASGHSCITPLRIHTQACPPSFKIEYIDGLQKGEHSIPLCPSWMEFSNAEVVARLKADPVHGVFIAQVRSQQLDECLQRLKGMIHPAQVPTAGCRPALNPTPRVPTAEASPELQAKKPSKIGSASRRGRSGPAGEMRQVHASPQQGVQISTLGKRPLREAWKASPTAASEQAPADPNLNGLFEAFRVSRGVQDITSSFSELYSAAKASGGMSAKALEVPLDVISSAVGSQQRFARALWERLAARRSAATYCGRQLAGHRAVVIGAGPVGLRCALELRLLGADVMVLEKRRQFDRINRLHLWPWCADDLKGWGAKILEPPELSFGADPDFLHIGIGELQMLLLKPCLLLGVQVYFGAEFVGCSLRSCLGSGSQSECVAEWDVLLNPSQATPGLPERLQQVSILVGADGPRGVVAKAQGLTLQETSSLRRGAALGLVANYTNFQSSAEKKRRSFSLARQFYTQLFEECEKETGLELENIVCYIAPKTHYFVMTPTHASLKRLGVLSADAADDELLKSIDQAALSRIAGEVARFRWKPEEPIFPEESLLAPVGAPALFDFSTTRRAETGLHVARATAGNASADMLVGLCGDALLEPFWPEGLGIMRGFFAALDLASAAKVWAETGDAAAAQTHFEAAFRQLKSLAAKTRDAVLKSDANTYDLCPSTRYRAWGMASAMGSRRRAASMPSSR
eukprot:TRINITY_DN980_c1_g2_i1.p1 TRINITY_DN980_c1_g2~~TRINITY_DN980_c1_g2_i1.p1  ORF type:complete len:781 (+),score=141.88 TRINITY_DN980_c1_g2_i1:61-2343(+)